MPFKIVASQCTGCSACESQCPNTAIFEKGGTFVIDPKKCTECVGFFDEAQCKAVCPVDDTCIIDLAIPRYQATA
jgi:ferredoxin